MNLSQSQIQLKESIQSKIRRGDVTRIADATGFSKSYVGMVLSPSDENYNEDIINEAVRIIELRDKNTTNNLKKLTAA